MAALPVVPAGSVYTPDAVEVVPVDDASATAEGYSALPHQRLADKLAGTETVVEGVDREKVVGDAQRQLVASVVAG